MIEFKFSCPNCSQHIKCDDSYSGRQIACPTCQKLLVVPPPPGAVPATATSAPPPPLSRATPPPPPISQAAAGPQPRMVPVGPAKSSKTKWIVIGSVAALLVAGVAIYAFVSGKFSDSNDEATNTTSQKVSQEKPKSLAQKKKKSKAAVLVDNVASTDTQSPGASEIIQKVTEQFDSLTSFSASGKSVTDIDMSGVDPKNIPGMNKSNLPEDYKNNPQFKSAMQKPQHMEGEITIKLAKPDLYHVQWENQAGPMTMKGASWSSGDGDFLLTSAGPQKPRYVKMQNRELALAAATGVSGGIANTLPTIFFNEQSSLLKMFNSPTRGADETIDGEDCFVLKGTAMGMQINLWITKSNFLLKQKQVVLGGNLNMPAEAEAKMREGMKQSGGKISDKQAREMVKGIKAMTSQMRGTMTETYSNIEINKDIAKEEFKHDVPPGTKLSTSLY